MPTPDPAADIAANCLMGRARAISRALTALYDEHLRGTGLQASQLSALALIGAQGPARRADLSFWLAIDASTLTRNLRPLLAAGWVTESPDPADARGRLLVLTEAGRALLATVAPRWRQAQAQAARLFGDQGAASIAALFGRLFTEAA